jgi:hypothetical protein
MAQRGSKSMKRFVWGTAVALAIVLSPAVASAQSALFNFDNQAAGTGNPFTEISETNSAATASFSSPADPSAFVVGHVTAPQDGMSGNYLESNAVPKSSSSPLKSDVVSVGTSLSVALNQSWASGSVRFLDNDVTGGSSFVVDALKDGTLVGTANLIGVPDKNTGVSYGTLDFTGSQPFDTLEFFNTGTANMFAIDDLQLALPAPAVPEPGVVSLFGAGVLGLLAVSRRKR